MTSVRRNRAYRVVTLALATVALTIIGAPSASAMHDSPGREGCITRADAVPGSLARGSDAREPGSSETAIEVPRSTKSGPNFRATVPVYFHVITDGTVGAVTQAQIDAQMTVLNEDYAGAEGGANTGFKFKLVGVDRTNDAAWCAAAAGSKDERDMKKALHQGGRETLNVYSSTADVYLGWSYFPNLSDSRLYIDGIVFDWESMLHTSTTYAGRYDLGKTLTHETGHWLNLYHVFQGGCNNYGDYVDDTPRQLIATTGCPIGQDSCSQPGVDSIHNYMDYSYDSCYNQFTAGQARRMQDAWVALRANG
jgi:hypothetical protein